jgi:hypothetical protein
VVTLLLTVAGGELAQRFLTHIHTKLRGLLGLLDNADCSALFRILTTLRDRLGSEGPSRSLQEKR